VSAAKTAVVTGANQGIGLETARQLVERGYRVIVTSRNAAAGKTAAAGIGAEYHPLDVTSADDVAVLAADLKREHRTVDVLVNNAGISMHGFNGKVVHDTLAVNFFGALAVTDALLPLIADRGVIVMVSSGMGELGAFSRALRARFLAPDLTREGLVALVNEFVAAVAAGNHEKAGWPSSAYRVSKAALNALARVLARDLAPRGIRVNAVCPGWVRTRMGGSGASRSVEKGAASVIWAATLGDRDTTSGGFFRDGKAIGW
jgi:NAD(P)-dependent dehydrogenase (short-subunit alcohol dehydrogenase family)